MFTDRLRLVSGETFGEPRKNLYADPLPLTQLFSLDISSLPRKLNFSNTPLSHPATNLRFSSRQQKHVKNRNHGRRFADGQLVPPGLPARPPGWPPWPCRLHPSSPPRTPRRCQHGRSCCCGSSSWPRRWWLLWCSVRYPKISPILASPCVLPQDLPLTLN